MKKKYFTTVLSLVMYGVFAQITITQADMPAVNDTIRFDARFERKAV